MRVFKAHDALVQGNSVQNRDVTNKNYNRNRNDRQNAGNKRRRGNNENEKQPTRG